MAEGLNIKFHGIIDMINHEIDGYCNGYMSRFNCEWYYNISIDFNYSNLHINMTISEETMKTEVTNVLVKRIINFIKAEIISNYFK